MAKTRDQWSFFHNRPAKPVYNNHVYRVYIDFWPKKAVFLRFIQTYTYILFIFARAYFSNYDWIA